MPRTRGRHPPGLDRGGGPCLTPEPTRWPGIPSSPGPTCSGRSATWSSRSFPTSAREAHGPASVAGRRFSPSGLPSWRATPGRSMASCRSSPGAASSTTGTAGVRGSPTAPTRTTPSTGVPARGAPISAWLRWPPSGTPWPRSRSTTGTRFPTCRSNGSSPGWTASMPSSRRPTTGSSSACWCTSAVSGSVHPVTRQPLSGRWRRSRSTTWGTAGTGTGHWATSTGTSPLPSTPTG